MLLDSNQRSRAQSREEEDGEAVVFGRPKSPEIRFQRIDAMSSCPFSPTPSSHFWTTMATREYSTRTWSLPLLVCTISYTGGKTQPLSTPRDVSFKASCKRSFCPCR